MKAVGGAGSGGPGPTDEGAVAMLLQLGKMMYEQKLQDKTPVSNEHKKPAQKRQGVRRYPQAGSSSAVSATAAARKKKDYVALNIEKYSSSYSRRKKPPVPQRKNVTSTRVSRTAPGRNALRSWSAPEVPARPASRGAGRAAPPTASAEPMVHKTRGDVVMHYPFCDDAATVGDLLRSDPANTANGDGTSPSSAFQDLPPPLQRKMIHRVFEEYRVSKTSMRVSDISESLKALGLPACHKVKDGEDGVSGSAGYVELSRWTSIAMDAAERAARVGAALQVHQAYVDSESPDEDEETYDIHSKDASEGADSSTESDSLDSPEPVTRKPVAGSKFKAAKKSAAVDAKTTKPFSYPPKPTAAQLQMRYDRRRYNVEKKLTRQSAARCIAEKRFDDLRENDFFEGPAAPKPVSKKASEPYYWREQGEKKITYGRVPSKAAKKISSGRGDIGQDEYQHSGKAALEIAEAFLQGDLYRHLLQDRIAEVQSESSSTDGSDGEEGVGGGWPASTVPLRPSVKTTNAQRNMSTRNIPTQAQKPNHDSKPGESQSTPYLDGWRSNKGGWVADFGPLHTHALSATTGARKKFQSNLPGMHKRKQTDEVVSEQHGYFSDRNERRDGKGDDEDQSVVETDDLLGENSVSFVGEDALGAVVSEQVTDSVALMHHTKYSNEGFME